MRMLRMAFRVARILFVVYGMWEAFLRSRWLTVGFAIWRILQRRRVRNVRKAATFAVVNGSDPAIYRRLGWRRITPRKLVP